MTTAVSEERKVLTAVFADVIGSTALAERLDPEDVKLIESARQERNDRERLERYHDADRYAVADQVAVIPFVYGRSTALIQPHVYGWWEFAKSSANFADLFVEQPGR